MTYISPSALGVSIKNLFMNSKDMLSSAWVKASSSLTTPPLPLSSSSSPVQEPPSPGDALPISTNESTVPETRPSPVLSWGQLGQEVDPPVLQPAAAPPTVNGGGFVRHLIRRGGANEGEKQEHSSWVCVIHGMIIFLTSTYLAGAIYVILSKKRNA